MDKIAKEVGMRCQDEVGGVGGRRHKGQHCAGDNPLQLGRTNRHLLLTSATPLTNDATTTSRVLARFSVCPNVNRRSRIPTLLLIGRIPSGYKRAHGQMHNCWRYGFRRGVRGELVLQKRIVVLEDLA
jgi:hypothetical protein